MVRKKCVKTPKKEAEQTRKTLEEKKILDKDYKVKKDKENVYFPVKKEIKNKEIETDIKIMERDTNKKTNKPKSLKQALKEELKPKQLENLVTSFDIIGDIAVIEIPEEVRDKQEKIGKAIMQVHGNVETVCRRETKTKGKYRIRKVHPIAGEEKTETVHREHGVDMKLDLNKTYFNPRLSNERRIIAEKIKPGEHIGYLFAGVGPFSLVIAKKNPNVKITAVELNPDAYEYLEENIMLNSFTDKIEPVHKDVKELKGYSFDRVIMPMPTTSEKFLDQILKNTAEKAVIHYYSLGEEPDYFEKPIKELKRHVENFKVLDKREVLNYAPGKKEVVIDIARE